MTPEKISKLLKEMERKAAKDPEYADKLIKNSGVYTPTGRLKKQYR